MKKLCHKNIVPLEQLIAWQTIFIYCSKKWMKMINTAKKGNHHERKGIETITVKYGQEWVFKFNRRYG